MATFSNLNDLAKHLNSSSGMGTLLSQSNVKNALQSEGERLERYLIEEMNRHYSSFQPEYYQRTGAWLESIRLNQVQQVGNKFSISITFDDDQAFHGEAYVPWLMEVGWKDHSYSTPHFQGFQGTHYIQHAVERWNADNKFGFVVTVYHGGERYI